MEWSAFSGCTTEVPLAADPGGGYVLLNAGRYGYYRVNYTEELWARLAEAEAELPYIDVAGTYGV